MKQYNFERFTGATSQRKIMDIRGLAVGGICHCPRRAKKTDRWPAIKYTLRRMLATGGTYSVYIDEFEIAVRRDS